VSGFDTNTQGNQTVIVEVQGKQASFTVAVKGPADPVTWAPATGVFARNITGIAYGNGRFVAIGYNDKPEEKIVAYSTDGITWTKAPSADVFGKNIIGIVYGNGKFVAAGYNDDKDSGYISDKVNKSIIAYSTDGITWTKASAPENFRNIKIVFGNGKFITFGDFRYLQTGSNSQWVTSYYQAESSDGVTWSGRDGIFPPGDTAMTRIWDSIGYIFFDGGKLIGLAGSGQYIYSANNGKSWKAGEETISIAGRPISKAAYGNGKFIGVGPNNALGWSTDGIIWTDADQRDDSVRNGSVNDVAYGFGMFVVVGSRGNIIYSRDGYTWKKVASSTFGSTDIHDIVYGDGKFVATGDNGRIAYSNKID
jgi:hypothetical protein